MEAAAEPVAAAAEVAQPQEAVVTQQTAQDLAAQAAQQAALNIAQQAAAGIMPATVPSDANGLAVAAAATPAMATATAVQVPTWPAGHPYACMAVAPQAVSATQGGGGGNRWVLNPEDVALLDQVFQATRFPTRQVRLQLASQLQVQPRQVQVWFQNKRQRVKSRGEPVPTAQPGSAAAIMQQLPANAAIMQASVTGISAVGGPLVIAGVPQVPELTASNAVAVAAAAAQAAKAAAEAAQAAAAAAMAEAEANQAKRAEEAAANPPAVAEAAVAEAVPTTEAEAPAPA